MQIIHWSRNVIKVIVSSQLQVYKAVILAAFDGPRKNSLTLHSLWYLHHIGLEGDDLTDWTLGVVAVILNI